MIIKSTYFELEELVCPDVFEKYGEFAWNFLDPRLLLTIDRIRVKIGKHITINNWSSGGNYNQRGLRCNLCHIVQSKKKLYMSAHVLGKGVDFDVEGMLAEEVRLWITAKKTIWPYNIRLERDVSWVHLDIYDMDQKVYLFSK
ncbi:MAG TPA: hypothetical protein PK727_04575 [Bacteroidales bacterium]|mgnify:CR=1 FL=1|nr:hypothetical protein [Bacteroidales bacterium]HOG56583.1 hypothetical protein [Bacteroidales bacterium]